jgi:hypothetical protein
VIYNYFLKKINFFFKKKAVPEWDGLEHRRLAKETICLFIAKADGGADFSS